MERRGAAVSLVALVAVGCASGSSHAPAAQPGAHRFAAVPALLSAAMKATMSARSVEVVETRTVGASSWSDAFVFQRPDHFQETVTRVDSNRYRLVFGTIVIGTMRYVEDPSRPGRYQVNPPSVSADFESGALWFPLQLASLADTIAGSGVDYRYRGTTVAPTTKAQPATFVGSIHLSNGLVTEGDITITPGADDGSPAHKNYSYRAFNTAPPVTAPSAADIEQAPASLGCPSVTNSDGLAVTICPNTPPTP